MSARRFLIAALALAACQAEAPRATLPKGDEIPPGDVEPVGFAWCDAARLELAAIVLNGPPKGEALEDVHDAQAPGCTWVSWDESAKVRLNVYDEKLFPLLDVTGPTAHFDGLARRHVRLGEPTQLDGLGARAARFGFAAGAPRTGVIVVETSTRVLEYEAENVTPEKLLVFVRGVTEAIENGNRET